MEERNLLSVYIVHIVSNHCVYSKIHKRERERNRERDFIYRGELDLMYFLATGALVCGSKIWHILDF